VILEEIPVLESQLLEGRVFLSEDAQETSEEIDSAGVTSIQLLKAGRNFGRASEKFLRMSWVGRLMLVFVASDVF